ncbi:MAG: hypothetical protein AB7U85_02875 [Alphaproteobacteria bacterium]
MKSLKVLLLFMVFVVSGCDNEAGKDDAVQKDGSVFEKLGYNPKWEEVPSINEFKDVFLKTTGQSFDDRVNDCAYKAISSIKKGVERLNSDTVGGSLEILDNKPFITNESLPYSCKKECYEILYSNLNYLKKGHKLACKRSDFFRNLVEDGSSWLLSSNVSQDDLDDWFWDRYIVPKDEILSDINKTIIKSTTSTIYDLFIVKERILRKGNIIKKGRPIMSFKHPEYEDVCKTVANEQGYRLFNVDMKNGTEKTGKIKEIKKYTNIAQSNVKLKDKGEPDYIIEFDYDNDGKKELIHRTYLYGEPEKGKPENSPDSGDGVFFGPTHCQREPQNYYDPSINRDLLTVYKDNIGKVKKYLRKTKTIEGWDHLKSIREKFGGKDLDYECLYNIKKLENADFFTFNGKNYIISFHSSMAEVILIDGEKYKKVCTAKLFFPREIENIIGTTDYIKASVAGAFPIYYVNDDSYLYDESLLDEIKKISYEVAFSKPSFRDKVEEYLKDKAKTICNVDLDKVQYKPENKAKILKLRKDNGEEAVLDETKIVKNITIPEKQKICGLNQKSERCTLYILNNSGKEVTARHFYILASKETGLYQEDIMYINYGYNDAVIKPSQFAQINIPVPFYLYYIEDGTEQLYVKD